MPLQTFDSLAAYFFEPEPTDTPPRFGFYSDLDGNLCFAIGGKKQFVVSSSAGSARLISTGNRPPSSATDGTDVTPDPTEGYVAEMAVQYNCAPAGIAILNGSALSGTVVASLYDEAGNWRASSPNTVLTGTGSFQRLPWIKVPSLEPGTYYVMFQFSSSDARFRAHAFGDFGASKITGLTFGEAPATIAGPTDFTASVGPIAEMYGAGAGGGGGDTGSPYLVYWLGKKQLFNPAIGKLLTYTQGFSGEFSDPSPLGDYIRAMGPGRDRPQVTVGFKGFGSWAADYQWLYTTSGQSTDAAATTGTPIDDPGTEPDSGEFLTHKPPLPDVFFCSLNGTAPSPNGPSSPANNYPWPDEAYQGPMVPTAGGINVVRNPGKVINRETPGITAGLTLAQGLPAGTRLDIVEGFAGSSSMRQVIGGFNFVITAAYNSGTITYVCSTTTNVQVGENFGAAENELTGITPSGYATGGVVTSVEMQDGVRKVIKVSAADPGAPTATISSGQYLDWGGQGKNLIKFAKWWVANAIQPGKSAQYMGHQLIGHESMSNVGTIAGGLLNAHDMMVRFVAHVKAIIDPGQTAVPIVHPQNNTPRYDFDDNPPRIGEASVSCCLMQDYVQLNDLDEDYLSVPVFMMQSGGGAQVNSPHFDMTSEPMIGSLCGWKIMEWWNGPDAASPHFNNDFVCVLDQPTKIFGTSSVPLEVDTVEVVDPNGFAGVQVFNLDLGNIGPLNHFSLEEADFRNGVTVERQLAQLGLADVDVTCTGATAFDPRRLYVAAGFKFPRALIKNAINSNIIAADWDFDTQQAVIDFAADIGVDLGGYCRIWEANGQGPQEGWNNLTPGWPVQSGSTQRRLVTTIPYDPGVWVSGGRTVAIAQYSVGRWFGNAHCLVEKENPDTPRYWNIMTGEWLRHRMLTPKPRLVFTRSSKPKLVDQRAEIGAVYPNWLNITNGVYDFGDNRTWNGTGNVLEALGNSAEDFSIITNMGLTGTPNSGSPSTYAQCTAVNGWFAPGASSTRWQNAHKRGGKWGWCIAGTSKTSSANQYWGATCAGEGTPQGAGVHLRVTATTNIPTIVVRDAAGATVFGIVLTSAPLADGSDFIWEGDIQDSIDGVTPGWGWTKINGSIIWEGPVMYGNDLTTHNTWVPPSTGPAQSRFTFGINGVTAGGAAGLSSSIRRWALGTRIYFATFGEGGGKTDESDWRPAYNSWAWRQAGNVF